jgi:hypothetical protein
MRAYDMLLKAVRDNGIFERNKIPLETKVLGCLLYLSGLSYRGMLLAVYSSYQRSSINAMLFVRMVLNTCTNKPVVLVDDGYGIHLHLKDTD